MTLLKTSLRNTAWRKHTPKINLSKNDILPKRLCYSRSRFSKKLMVSVIVSWCGKTDFFHWSAENKSWPELLHWSVEDFLTVWMLSTLSERWLWFLQDSVPSHRAKVAQQFLRQNTPDFIAADEWASYSPDLNPLDYCIWDILQDLVYEGRRLTFASLQDLKEAIKNKWNEVTTETVWKSIAQWKNDWMRLESRMETRFTTFSANCCDWISTSISCSETCWNYWLFCTFWTPYTLLHISLSKQKHITS